MAITIDGTLIANTIHQIIKAKITQLEILDIKPSLVVLLVGEDPASKVYVKNKQIKAQNAGINSYTINLPEETLEEDLIAKIDELNSDKSINGILIQLPLPKHINSSKIINLIDPCKDVDCFHLYNFGALASGYNVTLKPCTPSGCMHLIKTVEQNIAGLHAIVIGRSNIVGKPLSYMLLEENCTVTVVHSYTKNLPEILKQGDIVIAAVGKPEFIKKDWIKEGAIVIDVGINRLENKKIIGDVDYAGVSSVAKAITPVPGGVGPMTIAFLLVNTVSAACMQNGLPKFTL